MQSAMADAAEARDAVLVQAQDTVALLHKERAAFEEERIQIQGGFKKVPAGCTCIYR